MTQSERETNRQAPEPGSPLVKGKGTTAIGYRNRNGQVVRLRTEWPGTDYRQRVYVLQCEHCSIQYGANGSDISLRKCPNCQGGKPGV